MGNLITRRRGLLLATPALILPDRLRAQIPTVALANRPTPSASPTIAVSTPAGGAPSGTLGLSGTYGGAFTGTQIDYYWSTASGSPTGGSWITGIAASPSGGTWSTGGSAVSYPGSAATYYLFVRETSATSVVSSPSGAVSVSAHYLLLNSAGLGTADTPASYDYTPVYSTDLRIYVNTSTYAASSGIGRLITHYDPAVYRGFIFYLDGSGFLTLYLDYGSVQINVATAPVSIPTGINVWLRVLFNPMLVAGVCPASTAIFYTSIDNAATWQQVGSAISGITGPGIATNSSLEVGANDSTYVLTANFKILKAQLAFPDYSPLYMGMDFTAQTTGTTSFMSGGTNPVTITVNSPATIV